MKRFRSPEVIAARVIRKRKIEEKVRSFALRQDEAIRQVIDCQQGEAKRSYSGFVTFVISIIIIALLLVLFGRVGGQSPILIVNGKPLFVWLSRD